MDEAGGLCDACRKIHGPDPFYLRVQGASWQRLSFCPKCAGQLCRDLVGYLAAMKRKLQPPLF